MIKPFVYTLIICKIIVEIPPIIHISPSPVSTGNSKIISITMISDAKMGSIVTCVTAGNSFNIIQILTKPPNALKLNVEKANALITILKNRRDSSRKELPIGFSSMLQEIELQKVSSSLKLRRVLYPDTK